MMNPPIKFRYPRNRPGSCAAFIWLFYLCSPLFAAEFLPFGVMPNGEIFHVNKEVSDNGNIVLGGTASQSVLWKEGIGFIPLGFSASLLSGDGLTIAGTNDPPGCCVREAFVYTDATGMRSLDRLFEIEANIPEALSYDGTVVVGQVSDADDENDVPDAPQPYRWTANGGIDGLGIFPGARWSIATDVSADGNVITGKSNYREESNRATSKPFVWTENTGIVEFDLTLAPLGPSDVYVSGNGAVVGADRLNSSGTDVEAVRWSEQSGFVGLGWLPGTTLNDDVPGTMLGAGSQRSALRGINDDGSVIVGYSGAGFPSLYPNEPTRAFIWTEHGGMQDLQDLLEDDYGLATELEGWNLFVALGVSANGDVIIGTGFNPSGELESWLVRLGEQVPEPSTALLGLTGFLLLSILPARRV